MSKVATIHTRIDPVLKHNAEKIIHALGLSASQAINAFYSKIVQERGLPFELKLPNKDSISAMKELDSGNLKQYSSMKDLWDEIDNDK
jgi:DNA-damage-inducible protein J